VAACHAQSRSARRLESREYPRLTGAEPRILGSARDGPGPDHTLADSVCSPLPVSVGRAGRGAHHSLTRLERRGGLNRWKPASVEDRRHRVMPASRRLRAGRKHTGAWLLHPRVPSHAAYPAAGHGTRTSSAASRDTAPWPLDGMATIP